ncbi:MAG: glycosyltransferase [Vicinamibacteria bacterium]|nr:glycosyltransferase [Vicinamibacteria bacterium]
MSAARPEVSVLIAARNAAHLVDQQIASVLSQQGVRLELLACDDASTDGTFERLRRWQHDPRVRVLRNRRRLFPGATRNRLLALARGNYCAPCDADDLLLPGSLATLVAALRRRPRAGVAYGQSLQVFAEPRRPPRLIGVAPERHWDLFETGTNHAGSVIRTRLLRAVGGYRPGLRLAEDWDLMLRLREACDFLYVPRITTVWRLQPRSRSRIARGRAGVALEIVLAAVSRRRATTGAP